MGFQADFDTSALGPGFDAQMAFNEARVQRGMLAATSRAGQRLKSSIRGQGQSAGLGRLFNAYDTQSDEQRGRGVHPQPGGGFSASSITYVRSRSERTRGALQAYTAGADIRPTRGRWLWIPTSDAPRIGTGRQRVTPGNWAATGMEARVGPLVFVRGINGNPMLVVKQATTIPGRSRSARARTKTGRVGKGRVGREFLVMFIGIARTSRAARVDVNALHAKAMAELPDILASELRKA